MGASFHCLVRSYLSKVAPATIHEHLNLTNPTTGERKKLEELQEEALEESWMPFLIRWVTQYSFFAKLTAVFTILTCFVKTLQRLYDEIGVEHDKAPYHLGFWGAIGFAAFISLMEWWSLTNASNAIGEWGRARQLLRQQSLSSSNSSLTEPLLLGEYNLNHDQREQASDTITAVEVDEEKGKTEKDEMGDDSNNNIPDLPEECPYKAGWWDLLHLVAPDVYWAAVAFVFLVAAALRQV
jgi:hypothetical protein